MEQKVQNKFDSEVVNCFVLAFLIKVKHFNILESKYFILVCWMDPKHFVSSQLNIKLHFPRVTHCLMGAIVWVPAVPYLLYGLGSLDELHLPWHTCSHVAAMMHHAKRGECIISGEMDRSWQAQPIGENGDIRHMNCRFPWSSMPSFNKTMNSSSSWSRNFPITLIFLVSFFLLVKLKMISKVAFSLVLFFFYEKRICCV